MNAQPDDEVPMSEIVIAPTYPCPASAVEKIILPNNSKGRAVLDAILNARVSINGGKKTEAIHEDQP